MQFQKQPDHELAPVLWEKVQTRLSRRGFEPTPCAPSRFALNLSRSWDRAVIRLSNNGSSLPSNFFQQRTERHRGIKLRVLKSRRCNEVWRFAARRIGEEK